MAIAPKPVRNRTDIAVNTRAEAFIRGADAAAPVSTRAARTTKEPIILRFDAPVIDRIDERAKLIGLSRSAWVRMVVAKALDNPDDN